MPKDQPAQLEVNSHEVVFAGRIWDVVREKFDYAGTELAREFVKHPGAVAILAMDDQQRILMIRQYRHPVREYLWEIPAGLLDVAGESRLEAAKRELHEETGYFADEWSELISFHTTPGGNDETITIFLAKSLRHVGYADELEGEEVDMQVDWIDLAEALKSVLASDVRSPSAAMGIMALAHQLKG